VSSSSPSGLSSNYEPLNDCSVYLWWLLMTVYLVVSRPLHIAVAKGTVAAVDSIISIMLSLGVSLDYCNNLHQVCECSLKCTCVSSEIV